MSWAFKFVWHADPSTLDVCAIFVAKAISISKGMATRENCKQHVQGKIMRAREVKKTKSAEIADLEEKGRTLSAHLKMQDVRVEYLRNQLHLERAVSSYMLNKWGDCAAVAEQHEREAEVKNRLEIAEKEAYNLWSNGLNRAEEIWVIYQSLETLQRVFSTWEGKFEEVVEALFRYMNREDISKEEALQLSSLKCRCPDSACEFPFVVDASHRHL